MRYTRARRGSSRTCTEGSQIFGAQARDGGGSNRSASLVVVTRHQEHASDKLSGRDALGALTLTVETRILDRLVAVRAVRHSRYVIAVDTEVDIIPLEGLH